MLLKAVVLLKVANCVCWARLQHFRNTDLFKTIFHQFSSFAFFSKSLKEISHKREIKCTWLQENEQTRTNKVFPKILYGVESFRAMKKYSYFQNNNWFKKEKTSQSFDTTGTANRKYLINVFEFFKVINDNKIDLLTPVHVSNV